MITLEQFKNNTLGQSIGNPGTGTYVGECVSYVRQYMEQVLGIKTIVNGHAVSYYNSAFMAQHFDKVPMGQEQNGDILCWGDDPGSWTNQYGHIAIRYAPGQILNQNFGGNRKVTINAFFSPGYQGALRLKQGAGGNEVADIINLDTARIVSHGILARNGVAGRQNALDGSSDADLKANHVGKPLTNSYVQGLFLSGEGRAWRDTTTPSSIPGINQALASIPAKDAEIKTLKTTVVAKDAEIAKLKQQLAQAPTGGIDQATKDQITNTNTTVTWIKDLLSRVFK